MQWKLLCVWETSYFITMALASIFNCFLFLFVPIFTLHVYMRSNWGNATGWSVVSIKIGRFHKGTIKKLGLNGWRQWKSTSYLFGKRGGGGGPKAPCTPPWIPIFVCVPSINEQAMQWHCMHCAYQALSILPSKKGLDIRQSMWNDTEF